jgi:signal transduction histidine kinase
LDALITDVHDLSHRLHSAKLEHLGLTTTLQDLCQRLSRQHGLQIELQAENVPSHVPREVSLCFYRIAQEALSNVIRHSGSSTVLATVNESDGNLRMQIQDFGVGFDTTRQASGLGLATMQERLRTVGGKFSIVSHRGKGTVVTAEADLKASRKAA